MTKYKRRKPQTRTKRNAFTTKYRIPKSLRFNTDEYHTTFRSTITRNTVMSLFNDINGFTGRGITFQMSDCEGFQNWEKLFEEYRLNRVVVKFIPVQAEGRNRPVGTAAPQTQVPNNTQVPFFYCWIDRNDITAPVLESTCLKIKGVTKKLATSSHVVSFTPSLLTPVYQSQDPVSQAINYNYIVDYNKKFCQNNLAQLSKETPYWSLKYGLGAASPAGAYSYNVSAKYYVTFRKKVQ